jgi:hypothetical protein
MSPPAREPCLNGGTLHAWERLGLDINVEDVLVRARRCVWCPLEQEQRYPAGRWRTARRPT